MKKLLFIMPLLFSGTICALAQCNAGEVEVYIEINTDPYGYEAYWELLPSGNSCGTGTIGSGGNSAVGCNGGGLKKGNTSGYASDATITEGPWCLTDGSDYKVIAVDDWGDGGTSFKVKIESYPLYEFGATGIVDNFTFNAVAPPDLDGALEAVNTPGSVELGYIPIIGDIKNVGSSVITSVDLNYAVDSGTTVTKTIDSLSIDPFTTYDFAHPTPWKPSVAGAYSVKVWISNINGLGQDADAGNDEITKTINIKDPIPDITVKVLLIRLPYHMKQ